MTFAAPIGLLALLAVPAIVALHLFRDKLPERLVAGLFLFPGEALSADGGRKRARLMSSTSLWLECLIAVLLALWLAGPSVGEYASRHVVVVVDDSASMSAAATRERAGQLLQEIGRDLASDDEVTVVRSGAPAQVVVGPRAKPSRLTSWVAEWSPALPRHSLQAALDLGREIAARSGELVLLTDERPRDPCTDLRLVCCGLAMPNAALAFAQRSRDGSEDRVSVVVVGYGEVRAGELTVSEGASVLARVPVALPKNGGELQIELAVPQSAQTLRVELSDDALQIDNVCWLAPLQNRIVSVCDLLSPDERSRLELSRVVGAMAQWRQEPDPAKAELVLRSSPGKLAPWQVEMVVRPSPGESLAHKSPFILDRSDPLLSGVEMAGVHWLSGGGDLPGKVLVASGNKVLVSVEALPEGARIWCDVDGKAGNFVRSPDWPILFANVLEAARRLIPGCSRQQLRVGDELFCRCRDPRDLVEVRGPDGDVRAVGEGSVAMIVEQAGVYQVWQRSERPGESRGLGAVAVRFQDPSESDLGVQIRAEVAAEDEIQSVVAARPDGGPIRRVLAILMLLLVSLNWWLMHRERA
jgi:hypothetical protein